MSTILAKVRHEPIGYQGIVYYSAPKQRKDGPQSLDEVDPKLLETYEKLGIPLRERERLAGVAVDAVFDSVSVATTFRETLAAKGIVFCSYSEAVRENPDLVRKALEHNTGQIAAVIVEPIPANAGRVNRSTAPVPTSSMCWNS